MKFIIRISVIMFTLLNSSAYATTLAVKLFPRFTYRDTDKSCVLSEEWRYIYFNATVDAGGKITEANFKDSSFSFPKRIDLLPEELTGIEFATDTLGAYYVTTLPVSTRLLKWMFFYVDSAEIEGFSLCHAPKPLASVNPSVTTYKFTQKDAGVYYTPTVRFKGDRNDQVPYIVTLGWSQTVQD